MNNQAIGARGNAIMAEINKQLLIFEEKNRRNQQCLMECTSDLIDRALPKYLTGEKGKTVQKEACLVVPFNCYSFKEAIQTIGSRKPLLTQVNTNDIVIKAASNPSKPYIMHSIEINHSVEYKKDRKHLTFEELISWCMISDVPANTAFFSAESKINDQIVGIAFDNHRNPKVITSNTRNSVNVLTRHREVIV